MQTLEAMILKTRPYRESSLLVTAFSPLAGKLSLIAKGAHRRKQPWGQLLQTFAHVDLHLYRRHQFITLSGVELRQSFFNLTQDYKKASSAYQCLWIVQQVSQLEAPDPQLFQLILSTLQALETQPGKDAASVLAEFKEKVLVLEGVCPEVKTPYNIEKSMGNYLGKPILIL